MFIVLESFPSHAVFGEETKWSSKESNTQDIEIPDYFWVVDGTDSCICDRYEFGTLNSLLYKGKPVLGIVDQPNTKGRWIGVTGRKTTKNCEVSAGACQDLVGSCMDVKSRHYNDDAEFACDRMVRNAGLGRRLHDGSCFACGILASGFVDLLVDYGLDFYDFPAMILVVEGAGGVIKGNEESLHKD